MKKIFLLLVTFATMGFLLTSCGSKSKTEYDIEELGQLYEETQSIFEKESEYLTDDELLGDKGRELYEKCSKKTGLPYNKEITIRGKKESDFLGCAITSSDGKYNIYVPLKPGRDTSIFVNDGENVIVKGIFSKDGSGYGLNDGVFLSPNNIDLNYPGNNVADSIASLPDETTLVNTIIYGEITDLLTLDELKEKMGDYYDYNKVSMGDSAMRIDCPDEDSGFIYLIYPSSLYDNLARGNQVAVQGDLISYVGVTLGGRYTSVCGIMYSVNNCYDFTSN